MNSKNNILIVGATGFIGYHLAKKSLKKGWRVTSISTKPPKKLRYLPKVKYVICDIRNKKSLEKKIKGTFTYVVNLGGYVDHSKKKKTFDSHYLGCKNLAQIFLTKKIKSFVQMGSSVEYGNLKSPQKENGRCNPKSVYGKAKLLASNYLLNLYKKKNFPVTILRLYLSYGPKQDLNRFIPIIIDGCKKNIKFPCSRGNQYRDFVHVNDVVNIIIKSLFSKNSKGEIINVGSGKPKKLKKIIQYVRNFSKGGHPQFGKIKLRKDEILKIYPNIKKAKKLIRWKPRIPFERGIKNTIKYYRAQQY